MAHYAKLSEENEVVAVHCVNNKELLNREGVEVEEYGAKFLDKLFGEARWVKTSYNTRGGKHKLGGTPLRANYCGKGWVHAPELDIFSPPQPYPSWTLDGVKGRWTPPTPRPNDDAEWNEDKQEWEERDNA